MTDATSNLRTSGAESFLAEFRQEMGAQFACLGRTDIVAATALAIVVFVFSVWRIDATHAASLVNNCIFGADSMTFWRWLEEGNYLGLGVHKHSLAVVLVAILAQPLVWLGLSTLTAVTVALAAIWGAVAVVAFTYFRKAGSSLPAALAMAVLAMSTLGISAHMGIAETYGATLLAIGIACLLLPAIAKLAERHTISSAIIAGAIGAGLALANAPSTAFLLVYFACLPFALSGGQDRGKRLALCVAIPAIFVLVAVTAPALAAEGAAGASWHRDYLGRYSNASNFTNAMTVTNYLVSVFVFAFVGPFEFLQCRFLATDLVQFGAQPLRLIAYLTTISLVIFGTVRALLGARRRETVGLLGAIVSILAFYLYFNPDEALLYSPQWLLALFFAASPDFSRAWIWAGAAAALCMSVNLPTLHDPRTFDPEQCCPTPPASMLPREMPSALGRSRAAMEEAR